MWWWKCILPFPTGVEGITSKRQEKPRSPLSSLLKQDWLLSLLHCKCQQYVCAVCTLPPHFCHFLSSLMWFCYHANSWELSNKSSSRLIFYSWSLCIHFSICSNLFSNLSFTTVPATCFSLLLLHLLSFQHLFCCYDFGGEISSNLLLKFRIFF